jgi:hypothetical protein
MVDPLNPIARRTRDTRLAMDRLNRRMHGIVKLDATATSAIASPSLFRVSREGGQRAGRRCNAEPAVFSWVHH